MRWRFSISTRTLSIALECGWHCVYIHICIYIHPNNPKHVWLRIKIHSETGLTLMFSWKCLFTLSAVSIGHKYIPFQALVACLLAFLSSYSLCAYVLRLSRAFMNARPILDNWHTNDIEPVTYFEVLKFIHSHSTTFPFSSLSFSLSLALSWLLPILYLWKI